MTIAHLMEGARSIDLFPSRTLRLASRRSSAATRTALEQREAASPIIFAMSQEGSVLVLRVESQAPTSSP